MSPRVCSLCLVALVTASVSVPTSLSSDRATPAATLVPTVEVTVRSGSPSLPTGCGAEDVVALLTAFLDAFNRGDRSRLVRFFSTLPMRPAPTAFQWYSVTGGGDHFVARDLPPLLAYFAERHEQDEVQRLVRLEVAAGRHGEIGVAFDIVRRADDFPERLVGGKGAIDCERRGIFVWSMGDAPALTDLASPAAIESPPFNEGDEPPLAAADRDLRDPRDSAGSALPGPAKGSGR